MDHVEFGRQLKTRRKKRGWTETDLAGKAEVSTVTVKSIEAGTTSPTLRTMRKILDVLGATLKIRWTS